MRELIVAQGGSGEEIDNPDLLAKAKYVVEVKSDRQGYVTK